VTAAGRQVKDARTLRIGIGRGRALVAALLALALPACAGKGAPSATPPATAATGAAPASDLVVGPRVLLIDTEVTFTEDSAAREEHRLRLVGDLAVVAAAAMDERDPDARNGGLQRIADMLLGREGVEVLDARRLPSGEVDLHARMIWDEVGFRGDLRLVETTLGAEAAVMGALAPMTIGPALAAAAAGKPPELPERWSATRVQHRVVVLLADGYRARPLPPPLALTAENVSLARTLAAPSPLRIEGTLSFEIREPGTPVATVEQLLNGLAPADRQGPSVELEMVAETLVSSQRLAEAVAEARRLVEAHPDRAYYRSRQATVLLSTGLVDAARAAARRAVAQAPDVAFSHQILAWTLEADGFGRAFGPGYDRAGALAARRRQLELTGPKGRGAYELARLLAHDELGRMLGPRAPLDEILKLVTGVDTMVNEAALLRTQALLSKHRGAEAEAVVREQLARPDHNAYLLAAIALARGAEAAVAELPALSLSPDATGLLLIQATNQLLRAYAYPQAAALATAGARVSSRLNRLAEALGRLRAAGDRPRDPRPAVEALARVQLACATPESFRNVVPALLDPRLVAGRPATDGGLYESVCRMVLVGAAWPPPPWTVDYEVTQNLEVTGDERQGYRVRYLNPPGRSLVTASVFYFTGSSQPRLLGRGTAVIGDEALRLVEARRLSEAAVWLTWAREAAAPFTVTGRPAATTEALNALWPAGAPLEARPMREAAAAAAAYGETSAKRAAAVLGPALASARDPERRLALVRPLLAALAITGAGAEGDRVADAAAPLTAKDPRLVAMRASAAMTAGNCPKALALVRPAKPAARDIEALRRHANIAAVCGAFDEAVAAYRQVVAMPGAAPADYNGLGWLAAATGQASEGLTAARRAAEASGRNSPSHLHTLAYAAARAGALGEARDALRDALAPAPAGQDPLNPDAAWLVVGAIAESVGMRDDAVAAYRRVLPDKARLPRANTTYHLARRRLEALAPTATGK
jgi:tetratricopeptide (TPR) repeat protein